MVLCTQDNDAYMQMVEWKKSDSAHDKKKRCVVNAINSVCTD